jgi:hypothetical protein
LSEVYGVNRGEPLTEAQVDQLKKELQKADLTALKEAANLQAAMPKGSNVVNLTAFLEEAEKVKEAMYGGGAGGEGDGGGGEGVIVGPAGQDIPGDYKRRFTFKVVGGFKRGDYQGAVIKVDVADTIKGVPITLENVEVQVKRRRLLPSASNPNRIEADLQATKAQVFDIEAKYGAATVGKIGVKRLRVNKGRIYHYTLNL